MEPNSEIMHMLELADENFKVAILTVLQWGKVAYNEWKFRISQQKIRIHKKKNPVEILELKTQYLN